MRQSILMVLIIGLNISRVTSKSHCIGTCYSGQLFPEPQDIFLGKHLKGNSYKNITTDDPVKCYSSCIQDCRCKACQMKDTRCELLDEDKTSKADDFVPEPGYVYFDITQTMYHGTPHSIFSDCYNGCCRSQPCMNGGTCVEHCKKARQKFTCTCRKGFDGKVCDIKKPSSCLEVMLTEINNNKTIQFKGVYTIQRSGNEKLKVYCDIRQQRVWTMIESFALRKKTDFEDKAFSKDYSVSQDNPSNWEAYRLSLRNMNYIRLNSTLFRSTCDFDKRESLSRDRLVGSLQETDIFSHTNSGTCHTFLRINIRGQDCFKCTAPLYKERNEHVHMDTDARQNILNCGFKPQPDPNVKNADYFGFYRQVSKNTSCTVTDRSTTQWWLGEEI